VGQDPIAALAWVTHLPRGTSFNVFATVVGTCAQTNGKLSADYLTQNFPAPGFGGLHNLMVGWAAYGDSAAAGAWCLQAPKNARYLAFFSVGDGWFVKNQPAASDWAVKLEAPEDRYAAIHGVALKWGRKDIPAATVWIKTLKPDEIKIAVKAIAGDWGANKFKNAGVKDDAAMKTWLEQFPLSDAEKEEDLKGTPLSTAPKTPLGTQK